MKTVGIILFVLLCLVQLAVPSKMVFAQEDVLHTGHEYRFRTAPVDPYDPFRGKYVTLRFDAEEYETDSTQTWMRGEAVYVVLGTDSAGFAIVTSVQRQEPQGDVDYVAAEIQYAYEGRINLHYSFDRFYMDENKAPLAEKQYLEANSRLSAQEAYAVVYVKKGEAALKDVMVDGVSLRVLAAQPVE
jgi:uncharacterized membrane-anchored protein